jgi:hypothetical protein
VRAPRRPSSLLFPAAPVTPGRLDFTLHWRVCSARLWRAAGWTSQETVEISEVVPVERAVLKFTPVAPRPTRRRTRRTASASTLSSRSNVNHFLTNRREQSLQSPT